MIAAPAAVLVLVLVPLAFDEVLEVCAVTAPLEVPDVFAVPLDVFVFVAWLVPLVVLAGTLDPVLEATAAPPVITTGM